MDGKFISLIPLVRRDQFVQLFNASDGSAMYVFNEHQHDSLAQELTPSPVTLHSFDHGKYDPMRIWGFFAEGPFADSDAMMSADLFSVVPNDVQHFGIVSAQEMLRPEPRSCCSCLNDTCQMDNITNRLTGSVSLRNNQPQNLSIEIGKVNMELAQTAT